MAKTVFIAHLIAGDVKENVRKVLEICKRVHTKDLIPVAPYLGSLQYLDDETIADRRLDVVANLECLRRRFIDELWLFGSRISSGMEEEILLAHDLRIPIVPQTVETQEAFGALFFMKLDAR